MAYRTAAEIDVSHCLLCGSEGGAGSQCEVCIVERPSLDVEPTMNRACARCGEVLVAVGIGSGTNIHACLSCASLFVPARAWSLMWRVPALVRDVERRLPARGVRAPIPLAPCMTCSREMDRITFAARSGVVIDVCTAGHGVFLDAGALGHIHAYAASPPPIEPEEQRRDHLALEAALERARVAQAQLASSRPVSLEDMVAAAAIVGAGLWQDDD